MPESQRGTSPAPIGVFDSGVGGLTVLAELLRDLPDERYIYFGDTANCPYGQRTEDDVRALAANAARFLIGRGAKLIVVACNSATVAARESLRATFDLPFVVVVPAVKPAAAATRSGVVGIASTEVSARSHYLQTLIEEHANGVRVLAVGCPRLVTLAEAGQLDGPEVEATIRDYVAPMLAAGIDQLVLGCTHFPAMRGAFERVAGPGVAVIDSGAAIARRTRVVLAERQALASDRPAREAPRLVAAGDEFWCSGEAAPFAAVASAILGQPVAARHAPGMVRPPAPASGVRV
ncbi:MAG TPA: glutamate racemase [Steroidobacteraceae bacterium]|nr:glutamate racemase [Steroidobacteraceae bacterium]